MDRIDFYLEMIQYTPEDLQDFHSVVGAVIFNEKREILMMDHVKLNFWTIPIGKAKPSETVEEGLLTEVKEELDIIPKQFKEISIFKKTYSRWGRSIHAIAHLFLIESYKGKIKNNEPHKHRSIKFMSLEQIKKLPKISDMTKEMVKQIAKGNISV